MSEITRAIAELPLRFKGPGGAVAVIKDGAVIAREAWGYADLARYRPFTPATLFPICSISKQFTCALLLDQLGDPARLDAALKARLPALAEPAPRVLHLCHNQSGLRDYWALTVLCGAAPEGAFRPADATSLMGRTRTLHFPPGTQYSYSNGNFRLLSDVLEDHLGKPFDEMLKARILTPAGMATARLNPETGNLPGGAVGYEGDDAFGFIPAVNHIHWTGDAGMVATLDDMIAWERFIDATYGDESSLYRRLSVRPHFADGRPASYGFGLAHMESQGIVVTGHGGALRGWRSQRLHVAQERLSVVVLFNHESSAREAAFAVLRAALGQATPPRPETAYDPQWTGAWHEPRSGLVLDIAPANGTKGQLSARFTTDAEMLALKSENEAASPSMTLRRDGDTIRMLRPVDNLDAELTRLSGPSPADVTGSFQCGELDSLFQVTATGNATYASFEGFLGKGAMQPLYPIAGDIWRLPCRRSMDAPAPGDWTVHFHRDAAGKISGVTVGSWLARRVAFETRK
ncbi:D-aminopeptidase [Taklimakanibacter lacteus]|uniref:D-aminopeptidase n=1 Tax=Taklimakanibacter lacteus TaxID=2268456 RepID=UPI000E674322